MKFLMRLFRSASGSQTIESVPMISIFTLACVFILSFTGWDVIEACWKVVWDAL
jgi:hypothetical protein